VIEVLFPRSCFLRLFGRPPGFVRAERSR
jgi:hypothetical protein